MSKTAFGDIVRQTTPLLAKRGWYCEMNMPFQVLNVLKVAFQSGDFGKVDAIMAGYVQHHLKGIMCSCEKSFPGRWPILKLAFLAHRKKQYALSIPVFLAQADGICNEIFGVQLYKRKNKVPVTAGRLQPLVDTDLSDAFLEPLRIGGAISAYDDEAAKAPDLLNRHQVLHGLSIDYGTELNSFRSISLIAYVATGIPSLKWMQQIPPEQINAIKQQFKDLADKLRPRIRPPN